MVSDLRTDESAQKALEQRLAEAEGRLAAGDLTPEDAGGELGDWTMSIGDQRFLLHPAERIWYYYDRLHESWEPTEWEVGEWTLAVVGPRSQPGAIRTPPVCASCDTPLKAAMRFCPECGTPAGQTD